MAIIPHPDALPGDATDWAIQAAILKPFPLSPPPPVVSPTVQIHPPSEDGSVEVVPSPPPRQPVHRPLAIPSDPPLDADDPKGVLFPKFSDVVKRRPRNALSVTIAGRYKLDEIPTVTESYSRRERENFAASDAISDRIRAMLNNPFGKENLVQCFKSQAEIQHTWLPLWKSGLVDEEGWAKLRIAFPELSSDFYDLLHEFGDVNFNPLRGFHGPDWDQETDINVERKRMASAALLHFDGDVAALVRWIGGPHTNAHRDYAATLAFVEDKLPPVLFNELERLYYDGIPRYVNASATAANFWAFHNYGNHSSVDTDPSKSYKALVKDSKRGFAILFDERLIPFLLNCHQTPQGLVDLDTMFKEPRNIFDSTCRIFPWCLAINDWTNIRYEYPFPRDSAELAFMIWIFNLRITYPLLEIYLSDDDASGAFRWMKHHPNTVGMHTSVQCNTGVLNTGGTFGGNTTPANWSILGDARQLLAQWFWLHEPNVEELAAPFLPPLQLDPDPSPDIVAGFAPADPDIINTGVLDADGNRRPPPFKHHVDDNPYGDIRPYIPRAVASSTMALYTVLGQPTPYTLNPLSLEKLDLRLNPYRKCLGRQYNSRALTVGMCPHKREQLLQYLDLWLQQPSFTLLEASKITGILEHHTRYTPWARPWFFAIQNAMRAKFKAVYHIVRRRFNKLATNKLRQRYAKELPPTLWKRIDGLVSQAEARLLWNFDSKIKHVPSIRSALLTIKEHVHYDPNPFSAYIGYIIPRAPSGDSYGDASTTGGGGGAYSRRFKFWFDLVYTATTIHRATHLKASDPDFVHINSLEFIVVVLQVAAIIQRFRDLRASNDTNFFPRGIPAKPVALIWTDNTSAKSWGNRLTTKSLQGQGLLEIFATLLRLDELGLNCDHIKGEDNILADDLSRQQSFTDPLSSRLPKLSLKHPEIMHWDYFLPSQELLLSLSSRLSSASKPVTLNPQRRLGRFVPAASITFSSPEI